MDKPSRRGRGAVGPGVWQVKSWKLYGNCIEKGCEREKSQESFTVSLDSFERVVACHSWQGYKSPHGGALVDFAMDLATYQSHFQGINIQLFYASWM